MRLSLIIPCYNEEENIHLIFRRLRDVVGARTDIEVIIVNNGSIDKSQDLINAELENSPFFRTVNIPVNKGYGYGILHGLAASSGDVLAWTHADMQTDPKDALVAFDFYTQMNNENIIVKGKRRGRSLLENFFSFAMQCVVFCIMGKWLDDINAQPKIFSRSFYTRYIQNKGPNDFSLDLYILFCAKKKNFLIHSIPVVFSKRLYGQAKGGGSWKTRFKLIYRTFLYIFEFKKKLKNKL